MEVLILTQSYLQKFFEVELKQDDGKINYNHRNSTLGVSIVACAKKYIVDSYHRHNYCKKTYNGFVVLNLKTSEVKKYRLSSLIYLTGKKLDSHKEQFDADLLKRTPRHHSKYKYFKYNIIAGINHLLRNEFYRVFYSYVIEKLFHIGNDEGKFNYGDKKFVIYSFLSAYNLCEEDIPYTTLHRELTAYEKTEDYAQRVQRIAAFKQEFWQHRQTKIRPVVKHRLATATI